MAADPADQARIFSEQLGRFADRVDARLKAIETALGSHEMLEAERTRAVRSDIEEIKLDVKDHEQRIRTVVDQTTRNQVILGASTAGAIVTSIAAAFKAFVGP